MKTLSLFNGRTDLNSAVTATLVSNFGERLERLTAMVVYNYFVISMDKSNLKSENIVHDYTSKQIVKIERDFDNNDYLITYMDGVTRNVNANELMSVYTGVRNVSQKVKDAKPTDGLRFAVALVRKSRKGNNRFLHLNERFNASYANRKIFNTLKGAESFISTHNYVVNGSVKPNTMKVVAC